MFDSSDRNSINSTRHFCVSKRRTSNCPTTYNRPESPRYRLRRLTPPVSGKSSLVAEQLFAALTVSLRLNRARNGWVAIRVTVTWNPEKGTSVTAETGTSLLQAAMRSIEPAQPTAHRREITWRLGFSGLPRLHPGPLARRHRRDAHPELRPPRYHRRLLRRFRWAIRRQG